MSYSVKSVIRSLEKGRELCAICGKDVTGAPDCVHTYEYLNVRMAKEATINSVLFGRVHKRRAMQSYEKSVLEVVHRIGCEMLMDIPLLKSLQLCDPITYTPAKDTVYKFDIGKTGVE